MPRRAKASRAASGRSARSPRASARNNAPPGPARDSRSPRRARAPCQSPSSPRALLLRNPRVKRRIDQVADGADALAPGASLAVRAAGVSQPARRPQAQPRANPLAGHGRLERCYTRRRGLPAHAQPRRRRRPPRHHAHHVPELQAPAPRPAQRLSHGRLDDDLPRLVPLPAAGRLEAHGQPRGAGGEREQQRQRRPQAGRGQREPQRETRRAEHQRGIQAQDTPIREQDAERLGAGETGQQSPQQASPAGPGRTKGEGASLA